MARAIMTATRMTVLAPVAAALTISLFLLMQFLIRNDLVPFTTVEERPTFTISDIPEDEPGRYDDFENLKPADPPPAMLEVRPVDGPADPGEVDYTVESVIINTEFDGPVITSLLPPQFPTPLVRIQPDYPRSELSRGTEGSCSVVFDILGSGNVTNIRIAACDSSGFERSTIRAVRRWQYSASDGAAPDEVVIPNVSVTLDFTME